MIMSNKAANYVLSKALPDDFYRDSHRLIYATMLQMSKKSKAIDLVSLMEELKDNGDLSKVGGASTVARLCDSAFEPHLDNYIQVLKEKSERRQLRDVLQQNLAALNEPEYTTEEVFMASQRELYEVVDRKSTRKYVLNYDLMLDYIDQLERRKQEKKGISWGFRDMDRTIGMMMPGRVYYCGARPGVGKTALALTTIRNVARAGVPVYMASMEMSREQIADRQVSMEASIDGHLLQHGFLRDSDWSNVVSATNSLSNLPIATDDERQTTSSLFLKVRQFRMDMLEKAKAFREQGKVKIADAIDHTNGLGLVVVDYFQLFKDPVGHMDKDQWTTHVSGTMVDLAKDLQVPVLCLTQLNRESEKRSNKRPQLSDLRGGGAQEQDAWVVLLLHRPNAGVNDMVDVIVEKNRSGPTGTVQMKFHAEYTRFHSLERWVS